MIPDHLELIAKWLAAPNAEAMRWFESRGFSVQPMQSGLLLGAVRSVVESRFGVTLREGELPRTLPVPSEQQGTIASITVLKPRHYLVHKP